MKITIDLPRPWEAEQCILSEESGSVDIVPRFTKKKIAPFMYVTVTGASGRSRTAVVAVNGTTGGITVNMLADENVAVPFDTMRSPAATNDTDAVSNKGKSAHG